MTDKRRSAFVERLIELHRREDRGALAHLRRGLKRPAAEAPEMWPYVVPFSAAAEPWDQERYFLVAALFATHPCESGGDVGRVFRDLDPKHEVESNEKRFVALLNADKDELGYHLAAAIQLARSRGVAVDYDRLFKDLKGWSHPARYVQMRWAESFWGPRSPRTEITTQQGG